MTVANPPLTSRRALGVVSAAFASLVALALLLPTIRQDAQYHLFADQRTWLGVPRAADVLSNLAFVAVGLFGVLRLSATRRPHFGYATEASLWCVALGFIFTGLGSAWYHLQPNDATLVWDRLPMTLVFAGVTWGAILTYDPATDEIRTRFNHASYSVCRLPDSGVAGLRRTSCSMRHHSQPPLKSYIPKNSSFA